MSNLEQQYAWIKRYGMPVLYFDPMPSLGPYINQRAMFRAWPRPVRWMPTNWLVMPVVLAIDFVVMVRRALSQAKGEQP